RLLVVRIKLEQRRVVRLLLGLLGGGRRGFELRLEVVLLGGHSVSPRVRPLLARGFRATLARTRKRPQRTGELFRRAPADARWPPPGARSSPRSTPRGCAWTARTT